MGQCWEEAVIVQKSLHRQNRGMSVMVDVSVIIPVYGVRNYLEQCMDSVLGQTFREFEVILVDDGSTDGCAEICDRYAETDSRVRVVHKKNEGAALARNYGLQISEGAYIAYVDGDDWIDEHMLETLYQALRKEQTDIVMCGRYEDVGDSCRQVRQGLDAGRYGREMIQKSIFPKMISNGDFFQYGITPVLWDKMYKRELLEKHQMDVDSRILMGEDAACVYPCVVDAESICILDDCLYHYRQSAASAIKSNRGKISERQRYQILFQSVAEKLKARQHLYDFQDQWKEFLLFLMVPRSVYLYQGIENLDFLFPFPGVKKGSRVIVYGMGTYGQFLYRYLKETAFCQVVAAADRNYQELLKQGLPVIAPEEISKYQYDAIVVASCFAKTTSAIYRDLSSILPKEKIHVIDVPLIRDRETMKAFGLE